MLLIDYIHKVCGIQLEDMFLLCYMFCSSVLETHSNQEKATQEWLLFGIECAFFFNAFFSKPKRMGMVNQSKFLTQLLKLTVIIWCKFLSQNILVKPTRVKDFWCIEAHKLLIQVYAIKFTRLINPNKVKPICHRKNKLQKALLQCVH